MTTTCGTRPHNDDGDDGENDDEGFVAASWLQPAMTTSSSSVVVWVRRLWVGVVVVIGLSES